MAIEQTYVMIKPDGVKKGFHFMVPKSLSADKLSCSEIYYCQLNADKVDEHYSHICHKGFYAKQVRPYMTSGTVACFIATGENAVAIVRGKAGPTNPRDCRKEHFRNSGVFEEDTGRLENILHCSDSIEAAQIEISRFMPTSIILEEKQKLLRLVGAKGTEMVKNLAEVKEKLSSLSTIKVSTLPMIVKNAEPVSAHR